MVHIFVRKSCRPLSVFRLISVSMGLSACNSSGHLSNHADIAPNHAGITFAISNTLVSVRYFYFNRIGVKEMSEKYESRILEKKLFRLQEERFQSTFNFFLTF